MNPTNPLKTFLLNEMATAQTIDEIVLAYKALANMNRLMLSTGAFGQSPGGPPPPQAPPPQAPPPYNPQREPSWEDNERMPWEDS